MHCHRSPPATSARICLFFPLASMQAKNCVLTCKSVLQRMKDTHTCHARHMHQRFNISYVFLLSLILAAHDRFISLSCRSHL